MFSIYTCVSNNIFTNKIINMIETIRQVSCFVNENTPIMYGLIKNTPIKYGLMKPFNYIRNLASTNSNPLPGPNLLRSQSMSFCHWELFSDLYDLSK